MAYGNPRGNPRGNKKGSALGGLFGSYPTPPAKKKIAQNGWAWGLRRPNIQEMKRRDEMIKRLRKKFGARNLTDADVNNAWRALEARRRAKK